MNGNLELLSSHLIDKPVIEITNPEEKVIPYGVDSDSTITVYNYDNSHVIFKGQDLGSFTELAYLREEYENLLKENVRLRKIIDKIVGEKDETDN